jgi:hypothetical protein
MPTQGWPPRTTAARRTTQELALLAALAHEQHQAAIVLVCLDDVQRDLTAPCQADLEELAAPIRADVDPRRFTARGADDLHPSPDRGEPPLQNVGSPDFLSSCR